MAEIFIDAEQRRRQLVQACQEGDVSQVRRLIRDPRTDVNASTKCRFQGTPLTAAAGSGQTEVVKVLLSSRKDLDPNIKDGFGRSAYYYALKGNHADVMKHLNKDKRHRPATATEAMMECPLESVDQPPPVQLTKPVKSAKISVNNSLGKSVAQSTTSMPTKNINSGKSLFSIISDHQSATVGDQSFFGFGLNDQQQSPMFTAPVPAKDSQVVGDSIFSRVKPAVKPMNFFFGNTSGGANDTVVKEEIHEFIFPDWASEKDMDDFIEGLRQRYEYD